MGLTCKYCGVKLFGDEIGVSTCANCQIKPSSRYLGSRSSDGSFYGARVGPVRKDWQWVFYGIISLHVGVVGVILSNVTELLAIFLAWRGVRVGPVIEHVPFLYIHLAIALLIFGGIVLCCLAPRHAEVRFFSCVTAAFTATYLTCAILWVLSLRSG